MKRKSLWISWIVILAVLSVVVFYGPDVAKRFSYAAEPEVTTQPAVTTQPGQDNLAELARKDTLSPLFRAVSKAVMPAVVEVRVTKMIRGGGDIDELLRRFFGDEATPGPFRGQGQTPNRTPRRQPLVPQRGLGSGVVIDAANGYVLTNWHVVNGADEVQIVLADRRQFKAEWVRSDSDTDLAIVKIKPENLVSAPLGDSDQMEVGDWVLAIGSPRGLPQTVTAGIISAKSRYTGGQGYENFLQTDAAINQGNSGGPLVNMRGQVIGINSRIITSGLGNEGIGLSIPSNMVLAIMKQLIAGGKVVRGFLGVSIQNVDDRLAKSYKLPGTNGALVSQVQPGLAAEKAGIQVGDFITAVNGKAVEDVNELRNTVAGFPPGTAIKLDLYRDGKKMTVPVTVAAKPKNLDENVGEEAQPGQTSAGRYGLSVQTLTKELAEQSGFPPTAKGVIITEVAPESDASDQGLEEGMLITHVQDQPVTTADEFTQAIDKAKEGARLRVRDRQGRQRIVFITPRENPSREK